MHTQISVKLRLSFIVAVPVTFVYIQIILYRDQQELHIECQFINSILPVNIAYSATILAPRPSIYRLQHLLYLGNYLPITDAPEEEIPFLLPCKEHSKPVKGDTIPAKTAPALAAEL